MAFADTQVRKLRSKLSSRHIKSREAEGQTLHYLEGWHVVAEANRIFGFDGWDRETVSSDCVWTRQLGQRYCAAYVARVRITVRAGDDRVIREGCGVGESNAASPEQAHDFAAKAAETDATKRALSTFGNAFGLSLYGGAPVSDCKPGGAPAASAPKTNGAGSPLPGSVRPPELAATNRGVMPEPKLPVPDADIFPPDQQKLQHQPVDKSVLVRPEPRRIRDPDHLRFVVSQPCLICGRTPTEAHHLRFAQPRAIGRKVSDAFTVPLCALHHRDLHAHGVEATWWTERKLDPMAAADRLWSRSRNHSVDAAGGQSVATEGR